ncbi:MAG: hypothetical protein QF752_00690 [Planctomycetota bacterium]|jgi:hypothetical protein|nr:hypothetical protein [Planctomycetota bacterium]
MRNGIQSTKAHPGRVAGWILSVMICMFLGLLLLGEEDGRDLVTYREDPEDLVPSRTGVGLEYREDSRHSTPEDARSAISGPQASPLSLQPPKAEVSEAVRTLATRLLNPDFTARDQMALADLVFLGTVLDVDYEEARTSEGELGPVHTFVTFEVEQIVKGRVENRRLTLRFFGGLKEDESLLLHTAVPLFDAGERFVLFVFRNQVVHSPLAGWERGCFRVIGERVYDYWGYEVCVTDSGRLAKGRQHHFPEVVEHRPGGYGPLFENIRTESGKKAEPTGNDPENRTQATDVDTFVHWLASLYRATRSMPGAGPRAPVPSASIARPFVYDPPRPIGSPPIPPTKSLSQIEKNG